MFSPARFTSSASRMARPPRSGGGRFPYRSPTASPRRRPRYSSTPAVFRIRPANRLGFRRRSRSVERIFLVALAQHAETAPAQAPAKLREEFAEPPGPLQVEVADERAAEVGAVRGSVEQVAQRGSRD